jgi:hypothetical protein
MRVSGKPKERDQVEKQGVDKRMIYKRILNTEYGRKLNELIWLRRSRNGRLL